MGITNAEILAVITGLISLIPTIGGIIALFPLGLVPLLQGSTVLTDISNLGVAVLVVLVNAIINQIVWNIIAPKILGDALELPLPFIIVGVFIGAAVGGVLGAFLVAPTMGTIRILVVYALNKLAGRNPFPEPDSAPEPAKQPQTQPVPAATTR
jgi:predicted PurR-regulated permease PerM